MSLGDRSEILEQTIQNKHAWFHASTSEYGYNLPRKVDTRYMYRVFHFVSMEESAISRWNSRSVSMRSG
jgi:hypothetical protein